MSSNLYRNGLVGVTLAIKRICQIMKAFGPALDAAIDRAVTAGKITSGDAATMKAALTTIQAACDLFRQASGY